MIVSGVGVVAGAQAPKIMLLITSTPNMILILLLMNFSSV
jgi:hypothetical protein